MAWLAIADTLRTESMVYDEHKLRIVKEILA